MKNCSMEILMPKADLDLYSAPLLKQDAENLIKQGIYEIVVDLQNCNFVDSSGIGMLFLVNQKLSKYGGKLIVINRPDSLKRIMHKIGLPENFEIN